MSDEVCPRLPWFRGALAWELVAASRFVGRALEAELCPLGLVRLEASRLYVAQTEHCYTSCLQLLSLPCCVWAVVLVMKKGQSQGL